MTAAGQKTIEERYDDFCRDAEELLERAGLARPDQAPTIVGKTFLEACNALASLHLPCDKQVGGLGPRGLIWNMHSAVEASNINKKDPDPVAAARSVATVLEKIIKYRPPLDLVDKPGWEERPLVNVSGRAEHKTKADMATKSLLPAVEQGIRSLIADAKRALADRDEGAVWQCYFDFEHLIAAADPFYVHPETPGSLASAWYVAHWFQGNHPKDAREYFCCLKGVVTALEVWLLQPDKVFEAGEKRRGRNVVEPKWGIDSPVPRMHKSSKSPRKDKASEHLEQLPSDGLTAKQVLRAINEFHRAIWDSKDSLEWVQRLSEETARDDNDEAGPSRSEIRSYCDNRNTGAWRRVAATLPIILRAAEHLGLRTYDFRELIVDSPRDPQWLARVEDVVKNVEAQFAPKPKTKVSSGPVTTSNANDEFLVKTANLKGLLASRATNGNPSEDEYGRLRAELTTIDPIRDLLPKFVLSCHTIREFWAFIKPKFATHKERLAFLQNEFDPVLAALEQGTTGAKSIRVHATAPKPDLLVVTVNGHETKAVVDTFRNATGGEAVPVPMEGRLYHNLGCLNGTTVYHVISEMGSGGPGAMQQVVDRAIRVLDPGAVVAVGIAFGVNEKEQALGEILVSKQLRLYDLQRAGVRIVLRGDKPHASTRLINHFEAFSQIKWEGPKVWLGVVLSGEKLVDNIDYRDELLKCENEAIGGEMEGAGLYVSSHEHKVDWVVVKAICDWADGHKNKSKTQRQKKAAKNAATFLIEALRYAPLKRVPSN